MFSLLLRRRPCYSRPPRLQRQPISGRAIPAETAGFVAAANLPLHHTFHQSQLCINPVIHGPPRPKLLLPVSESASTFAPQPSGDQWLQRAVAVNRSNCFYVYQHHVGTDHWHASPAALASAMAAVAGHGRGAYVAIAGLGFAAPRGELLRRLEEALAATALEQLDIAVVDCDEATFGAGSGDFDVLNDALETLEALCREGVLQSYGLSMDLPPYCHHTPPARRYARPGRGVCRSHPGACIHSLIYTPLRAARGASRWCPRISNPSSPQGTCRTPTSCCTPSPPRTPYRPPTPCSTPGVCKFRLRFGSYRTRT